MLMTWTSPPCFSLIRRASSVAYSSKGLVMLATPSRISVFGFGSILTSVVSGTCLIHTAICTCSSSFSFKVGFSFFDKSGHTLLLVLGGKTEAKGKGLQGTGLCEIHIIARIDNCFGQFQSHRSAFCDLGSYFFC